MYVYTDLSGNKLTRGEFIQYIEKKVAKTISKYKLIDKNDKVGIAVSGGKDSLVLLNILAKQGWNVEAFLINEGIKDYREKTIPPAKKLCDELKIKLNIISYKEEFGQELDEIVEKGFNPCSICGVFRRKLLNKEAMKAGCTKLATGHNLDDEAQAILMNQFKHNLKMSARMGPISGISEQKGFVRRVKPLYLITEKEVMVYAFLHGLVDEFLECKYVSQSFRKDVQELLNNMEEKHPGSKQGIVLTFLENLPLIQEKFKTETPINNCERCNDPCSNKICKACLMKEKINLTN